ncbi:hypothetical protein AUJ87_01915 [Candidatus Gracilibacteria bacterium CG1_02_38_174]|nr:MAG: hypothetical protein AUJ87_01915 [Candidatus Gracilibacteria bacterium CG1_02_38_174]
MELLTCHFCKIKSILYEFRPVCRFPFQFSSSNLKFLRFFFHFFLESLILRIIIIELSIESHIDETILFLLLILYRLIHALKYGFSPLGLLTMSSSQNLFYPVKVLWMNFYTLKDLFNLRFYDSFRNSSCLGTSECGGIFLMSTVIVCVTFFLFSRL